MVTALTPTNTDAESGLPLVRRAKGFWNKPRRPIGETDLLVPSISSLLPAARFVGDGNRMRHGYPAWAATRAGAALVAPRRHFRRALFGSPNCFSLAEISPKRGPAHFQLPSQQFIRPGHTWAAVG